MDHTNGLAGKASVGHVLREWYPVVERGSDGKLYVTGFLLGEELGQEYVLADVHAGQLVNIGSGCNVAVHRPV